MNTLEQFEAFLYKTQNVAFEDARDNYPAVYPEYTKKGNTSKADYRDVTASKLGMMGYTAQGGAMHKDEYNPGTERVTKFKKFTIAVITPEELEADMISGGRVDEDKVELLANMTKDFAESAAWTKEVICSDFQLRGDATTVTNTFNGLGRDGLALFSASHVTTVGVPVTWSNAQTASTMTELALTDGVTKLENVPNERGRPSGAIKRIGIVYGRYWEWKVPVLLKTVQQVGTANNDKNSLLLRSIEWVPILNPYLGATETSWMLLDLDNHKLTRFEKQAPKYSKDVDIHTGNKINKCTMRFAIDHLSPKGALRNDGL